MSFIVATSSYPCGTIHTFSEYEDKLNSWLSEAKAEGASLAVFPEYGAIETTPIGNTELSRTLDGQIDIMTELLPQLLTLWQRLSADHQISIIAPSAPFKTVQGLLLNRCYFIDRSGFVDFQDKMIPTTFERDQWKYASVNASGHDVKSLPERCPLKIFDTGFGRFAILICYDCEFPALARAAIKSGAEILIVPSCTDTLAGYWRVRIGAMARALEGQCYVIQSALVGEADWSPSTDINIGAAGVFCPPDLGFADTGVITVSELNTPQWVFAEIDLGKISQVRQSGAVRGVLHWDEQDQFIHSAKLVKLR